MLLDIDQADSKNAMLHTAEELLKLGAQSVFLTGGHLPGELDSVDLLLTEKNAIWFPAERIDTRNTHGTGCTVSAAITAGLAKGASKELAVREAKAYISAAIEAADRLHIGSGRGPVHHFNAWW